MNRLIQFVAAWTVVIGWLAGIVLAKGFWSTTAAIFVFPLWSWYLVVERVMQLLGIV